MKSMACWLACCVLLVLCPLASTADTTVLFTLPPDAPSYWTSAAAYNSSGVLVRTLWRHERKDAGPHTVTWDNLNDDGAVCADDSYTVKVLYHNIDYQVAGTIGNTSTVRSNNVAYWRSYQTPVSLASAGTAGSPLFITLGYNEAQASLKKIDPAAPQQTTDWFRADPFTSLFDVATDGINIYLATRAGIQNAKMFVFAISATKANTFYSFGANGTDIRLNGNYENQHYPSCIDVSTSASGANPDFATGLAVQRAGQGDGTLLAVAHGTLNTVRLYQKTTGQLLREFTVNTPQHLAFAPNGDLWILSGTTILRYTNLSTTPTLAATIAGLAAPVNIAAHPTDELLLVADGGSSQQVKAFAEATTGTVIAPTWTLGQPGGWQTNGVDAANDKFGFYTRCTATGIADPVCPLAVLADGSVWLGDMECNRLLHFDASRAFLERVMYRPASYCAALDRNDPTRVFSNFLEYRIDYSQPLQPGDPEAPGGNGCWTFVRNWGAGRETSHADVIYAGLCPTGLRPVYTLANGRTYGVVTHANQTREIVELAASGLRFTGITLTGVAEELYPDGSRRSLNSYHPTGTVVWYTRPLTGFTAEGNPQWGTATVLASAPADARTPNPRFSYFYPAPCPVSANNVLIAFDPTMNYAGPGLPYTWHLGGIITGMDTWLWKGSPAVPSEVPFLGVGNYDVGDNTNYGGSAVSVAGEQVVYMYQGEFYNNGQASQWMHFLDDGLFVAQFGVPGYPYQQVKALGFAGNVYASELYCYNGQYYVYANDESCNAGIMLWKLHGVAQLTKLIGAGPLNGTISLGSESTTITPKDSYQVDLLIRPADAATNVGDNVYGSAETQTVARQANTGKPVSYLITLQNDGAYSDRVIVTQDAAQPGVIRRLFDAATGGNDITDQVRGGGWTSPLLSSGGALTLRAVVTLDATVLPVTPDALTITAVSATTPVRRDRVRAVTSKSPLLAGVTLVTQPATPQVVHTAITLSGVPVDGSTVEYQFRAGYKDDAGKWYWTVLQPYGPTARCVWTPTRPALYTVVVSARESGTALEFYQSAYYRITTVPPTAVTLHFATPSPQPINAPITLQATATGGGDAEYQFRAGYKDAAGAWHWTDLQAYSTANTCTWTPAVPGLYTVAVYAREVSGTVGYRVYQSAYYRVTAVPPTAVTLHFDTPSPQPVNTPIALQATATGSSGAEYQFRAGYKDAAGTWHWTDLQAYGTANTCTWTPTVPGIYTVVVYAREVGGAVGYRVYQSTYYRVTTPPPTGVTLTALPAAPRPVTTPITLQATATGGGDAEYRFRAGYKDAAGAWYWTDLQAYGTASTCTWTPTLATTYTLVVYVRELYSAGPYRAYSVLTYPVTPVP